MVVGVVEVVVVVVVVVLEAVVAWMRQWWIIAPCSIAAVLHSWKHIACRSGTSNRCIVTTSHGPFGKNGVSRC